MWAFLKLFYLLNFWFVALKKFYVNVNNILIKILVLVSCTPLKHLKLLLEKRLK